MALYKVFDASRPPGKIPAGAQGVAGYIGRAGRTPHVWTPAEWDRFTHLRQFPIYVPDLNGSPAAAAAEAVAEVMKLGWAPFRPGPQTRVILVDFETAHSAGNRSWWKNCAAQIAKEGFVGVAYGSLSTVLDLAAADVWAAAWDGHTTIPPGQTIHGHQDQANVAWDGTRIDWSVFDDWMWARGGVGPRWR